LSDDDIWPNGARCCVCLTFDLDAEWVFMGNHHEVAEMPRRLSQGEYVWNARIMPRMLDLLDRHREDHLLRRRDERGEPRVHRK
jgi:hypothetical protein